MDKDVLYELKCDKITLEEAALKLGISVSAVRKRCKRAEITIKDGRSKDKRTKLNTRINNCLYCGKEYTIQSGYSPNFCSSECKVLQYRKELYDKVKTGHPSIMKPNYTPNPLRSVFLEEQGNKCAICGIEPVWNNKPMTFILDHIDGRASNNRRDNLRMICHNCDSQLPTYKSRNKKGERVYHRTNHR